MIWKAKQAVFFILCWSTLSPAKIQFKSRLGRKRTSKRYVVKLSHVPFNKSTSGRIGEFNARADFRQLQGIDFDKLETDLQSGNVDGLKQAGESNQELKQEIQIAEGQVMECGNEELTTTTPSTSTAASGPNPVMEIVKKLLGDVHGWVWPALVLLLVGGLGSSVATFRYIWHHQGFSKEELHGRRDGRWLLLFSFVVIAVLWVSSGGCILSTVQTMGTANAELELLENFTGNVLVEVDILQPVINSTIGSLQSWNDTCAVLVNSFLTKMDVQVEEYLCMGGDIQDQLAYVRDLIQLMVLLIEEAGLYLTSKQAMPILLITSVPNILVGILLVTLVVSALLVGKGHMMWLQKLYEASLKFIAFPLTLLLVILTVISVVLVFLAVGLKQLCHDVDDNLSALISVFLDDMAEQSPDSAGTFEMVKDLIIYYIKGDGDNPLHQKLGGVEDVLGTLNSPVVSSVIRLGWWVAGFACPQLGDISAVKLVETADGFVGAVETVTSRKTIHPMYATVVHRGLCTHVQWNIYFLVLGQVFSVFFAIPACAYLIHRFISQVLQYEKLTRAPQDGTATKDGTAYVSTGDSRTLVTVKEPSGHGNSDGHSHGHGH